jgi:hypothetical protein
MLLADAEHMSSLLKRGVTVRNAHECRVIEVNVHRHAVDEPLHQVTAACGVREPHF